LPQSLADVAFSLALNKPSQPIKSPLGWHILRVVEIVPPTTQSFDEVKVKLQADLAHDEAVERLYTVANHIDDALAGGSTLDEAVTKFALRKTVVAAVDEKGLGRDDKKVAFPLSPTEVLKLAFSTEEGRTSRVTQASDGAIFVLHIEKITPPTVRPLAEVKNKVIAAWQAEKRKGLMAKAADALAAGVKPGMQLSAVAAAKGLKATTSSPFQRQSENAAGVPPALVDKLFAAKPGGIIALSDATGSYVAQLIRVEAPQTIAKDATVELSRELTSGIQSDLGEEYTRALRARFPVEIHRETLDRLF
jgi:peptidyl-prolyl cis-trans isomerase D